MLGNTNQQLLDGLAHKNNGLGANSSETALALFQDYICLTLDAAAVTWCALYKGPYGKDVWHTKIMDDWIVFDTRFPKGVELGIEEVRSNFYAKARKEGGLGAGIKLAINSVGTRE